jgi:hypothetical protein
VLFSHCTNGLVGETTSGPLGPGLLFFTNINVTADQVDQFFDPSSTNVQCYAINSLFTAVTNLSGVNLDYCVTNAGNEGFYQIAGAAGYYLSDESTNRGVGTTNIPSAVLADLETKTTYPPVVVPFGWFTNDYTFFPQAQRDNSGSTVDLGYHCRLSLAEIVKYGSRPP